MNQNRRRSWPRRRTGNSQRLKRPRQWMLAEGVTDALNKGDTIQIIGFGTFETRKRNARIGVNPQTKEEIEISESIVPAFKAAKALKDAVKGWAE